MMKMKLFVCGVLVLVLSVFCHAAEAAEKQQPTPDEVVTKVIAAAKTLIESLDEPQRKRLLFSFDDDAQRQRWSNLPPGMVKRSGLRMGELNEAQQKAVLKLIEATLSERGYQQIIDNLNGSDVLKSRSRGRSDIGRANFYVSILGEPSRKTPWMWQFGGHHLAINATVMGDQITLSPSLTGGEPVNYELNGRKVRQLGGEIDKAFTLIDSLSTQQRTQAVVGDRPVDLAFGPRARDIEPRQEGIRADKLSAEQQQYLLALIEERIGILNDTHTKIAMEKIKADLSKTYFAWFGSTEQGKAATFRIQGPSVIIEYCPQQVHNDLSDHTHAMYRDPSNDYGTGFQSTD